MLRTNSGFRRLRLGTVALTAISTLCGSSLFAAQINGSIQTADGKPVPGATVVINIQFTSPATQRFSTIVQTAPDGTFSASGIPAGKFIVCPQALHLDLLSPCTWETNWPTTIVTQNQTVTMPPIRLKRGVHLSIRIDDPQGKRSSMEGTVPGAALHTSVHSPNGFSIPTAVIKADAAGHDHDILVPFDTSLEFRVHSKVFAIADDKGNQVDKTNGATVPIRVPLGTTPPRILFTVVGVN
jgi:hypothetical protein